MTSSTKQVHFRFFLHDSPDWRVYYTESLLHVPVCTENESQGKTVLLNHHLRWYLMKAQVPLILSLCLNEKWKVMTVVFSVLRLYFFSYTFFLWLWNRNMWSWCFFSGGGCMFIRYFIFSPIRTSFFSSWWGSLLILTREAVLSFNPFSRVSCLRRISTKDVSLDKAERSGIQVKDDDDGDDCERRSSWIRVSFPDNLKIKERRRTDPQNEVLENGMKEKLPEV